MVAVAVLAIPISVTAQTHRLSSPRYTLTDVGSLGGPNHGVAETQPVTLNNRGQVAGTADTATPNPYANDGVFNNDPYVEHTFLWRNGHLRDLGALGPHANMRSSFAFSISQSGSVAGVSENGVIDPLTHNPGVRAVLWRRGKITDLGTFGGNESAATAANDRGQAVGGAANSTPDPYSMVPAATQSRAFLWQHGQLRNLGTLGGPDSAAWAVDNQGEVAGVSYLNASVNAVTGQPTTYLFLWRRNKMRNLGNLGGSAGINQMNEKGQFVGSSDLKGDHVSHPYLWDGRTLLDLGTLGGSNGSATFVNTRGEVAGSANLAGDKQNRAFLWRRGTMSNLGTVAGDTCSGASGINSKAQVVGNSGICGQGSVHAFLWDRHHMVALNDLVAPTNVKLFEASNINDRGVIDALGLLPDGHVHYFVLRPSS
jgi:probable HAF family extracellular repeat protein